MIYKETKLHTPSTPEVKQPASATDPRFSTSGILNAQNKEKNRQGLFSTYGGRTGEAMDINKFANQKISMRDPSAVSVLEKVASLYNVARNTAGDASKASQYNASVDALNKIYSAYGEKNNLEKADVETKKKYVSVGPSAPGSVGAPYTKEITEYNFKNKDAINNVISKLGSSGEEFNKLAEKIKKQKKA